MGIVNVESRTFERRLTRFEEFARRMDALCHAHRIGEPEPWLDNQQVCLLLNISKRTLQTLRGNGSLSYTRSTTRSTTGPKMYGRSLRCWKRDAGTSRSAETGYKRRGPDRGTRSGVRPDLASNRRKMGNELITEHDERIRSYFQALERLSKALETLFSKRKSSLDGESFYTDEELSQRLKISRRSLRITATRDGFPTSSWAARFFTAPRISNGCWRRVIATNFGRQGAEISQRRRS